MKITLNTNDLEAKSDFVEFMVDTYLHTNLIIRKVADTYAHLSKEEMCTSEISANAPFNLRHSQATSYMHELANTALKRLFSLVISTYLDLWTRNNQALNTEFDTFMERKKQDEELLNRIREETK